MNNFDCFFVVAFDIFVFFLKFEKKDFVIDKRIETIVKPVPTFRRKNIATNYMSGGTLILEILILGVSAADLLATVALACLSGDCVSDCCRGVVHLAHEEDPNPRPIVVTSSEPFNRNEQSRKSEKAT